MKLTFKQYLESKNQLIEAVQHIPRSILKYRVKKYCTMAIGECEEEKTILPLKPNQFLEVEWIYENENQPSRGIIKFHSDKFSEEEVITFWDDKKLSKWLHRYTTKINNAGH